MVKVPSAMAGGTKVAEAMVVEEPATAEAVMA